MPETIEEQIDNYKSELLVGTNQDMQRNAALANEIESRLGTHLITISSVLLTVIGGFILTNTNNVEFNGETKVVLTVTIVSLLLSIGFGLVDFYLTFKFHAETAKHYSRKGDLIVEDESRTQEELDELIGLIRREDSKLSANGPILYRVLQSTMFVIGVVTILILVLVRIYS